MNLKCLMFWFIIWLLCPLGAEAAEATFCTWKQTEAEFSALNVDQLDFTQLQRSLLFSNVVFLRDEPLLLEMTRQRSYTLIPVAGFIGLKQLFPRDALTQAMKIVLQAPDPGSATLAPVYENIRLSHSVKEVNKALDTICTIDPAASRNTFTLMQALRAEEIYSWFAARKGVQGSALFQAAVLDRLCSSSLQFTPLMRKQLDRLKEFPGIPRLVWLRYAPVTETEAIAALKCTLIDESIDDVLLIPIVQERSAAVREAMKEVSIPSKRLKMITKVIELHNR